MMLDRLGKFRLSTRERQVLGLICEGKSSREIGAVLGIAEGTVGTYTARLFRVSHSHTRQQLRLFAAGQPQILDGGEGSRKIF